jgi:hypothetical protein
VTVLPTESRVSSPIDSVCPAAPPSRAAMNEEKREGERLKLAAREEKRTTTEKRRGELRQRELATSAGGQGV